MLEALFGNKSVERILFFLLVNEKCYATQLHHMLAVPLTPIQKALQRLERGGIIASRYEGKTRLFQFNPSFPLQKELELFLKQAYSSLTPQEKKRYYYVEPSRRHLKRESQDVLLSFWQRIRTIHQMTFTARICGEGESGWNGKGRGKVAVHYDQDATVLFEEEGSWMSGQGETFQFKNVFRWTLNRVEGLIGLEHLRFGKDHPVFLFHLTPKSSTVLESLHPHLCKEDTYFGQILCEKRFIQLNWRILGPKKNEEIEYVYQ